MKNCNRMIKIVGSICLALFMVIGISYTISEYSIRNLSAFINDGVKDINNKVRVIFDNGDDTSVIYYDKGSKYGDLPNPSRDGEEFYYWYANDDINNRVDKTDVVNNDWHILKPLFITDAEKAIIANNGIQSYLTSNKSSLNSIKSFLPYDGVPTEEELQGATQIQSSDSANPVYLILDSANTSLYYYSPAKAIYTYADTFTGTKFYDIDFSKINTKYMTSMYNMFHDNYNARTINLKYFDTSNVTDMSYMFSDLGFGMIRQVLNLDLSYFDTSKVTNMSHMFYHSTQLSTLNVSSFDTTNVTDMSYMFGRIYLTQNTLDLSNFNTSNVTNMSYMFESLAGDLQNLNLSNFNTSNVTDMNNMFNGYSLSTLDISNFNTDNVTNMSGMFRGTGLSVIDLSNFNTSKVTDMSNMFSYNKHLTSLNLSSFDTSNVLTYYYMFAYVENFTTVDLSSFTAHHDENGDPDFNMYDMLQSSSVNNVILSSFKISDLPDNFMEFSITLTIICDSEEGQSTLENQNHITVICANP